ncbi:MAG: hypothetical protein ABIL40_09010 [candidate division WOR-3 bacterium]
MQFEKKRILEKILTLSFHHFNNCKNDTSVFQLAKWRLSRIINKAMKRNPKARYKSAEDMLKALNNFLGWKNQALVEENIRNLILRIEQAKEVTTVVKSKTKKKKKTRKEQHRALFFTGDTSDFDHHSFYHIFLYIGKVAIHTDIVGQGFLQEPMVLSEPEVSFAMKLTQT